MIRFRIVTDVAGLDDHQILAVVGVSTMPVSGNDAADPTMIEREGAEVFGDQDSGLALIFVRTESHRRHDPTRFESIGSAQVVETRDKYAIAHHLFIDLEISHLMGHYNSFCLNL